MNTTVVPPLTTGLVAYSPTEARDFYEKSVSLHTRRAYQRVLKEFFTTVGGLHPKEVIPRHVLAWRELLIKKKQKPNTVAFKLSVIRSFFAYLVSGGGIALNPADSKLVPPPAIPDDLAGRALVSKEVRRLLAGPDRRDVTGSRDYAMLLTFLRLGLRISEVCILRSSSMQWSHGRWIIKFKAKGGKERTLPLPDEVRQAIKDYLALDFKRRQLQHSDGETAFLFQPLVNYRTLIFAKPLSERMVHAIVKKWGAFCGLGILSPHDLRRTAATRALDQGLSYRQVQMMGGWKDPKTVMRYDHGRENLTLNAINFLAYDDNDQPTGS